MARNQNQLRIVGGAVLAVATLLTRLPFRSHTLFEFDSINFAVATSRFNLAEVTPHMPGYILHVLLGRLFGSVTGDPNAAFVWLSIVLSIGSVLFFWRAAAQLRGERVAFVAAAIWLTTPLFWFHGCVNAVYIEEAFWTSALLYFGFRSLNARETWVLAALLITYSLAGAARQSGLLFFLPAVILVLVKVRPSRRQWVTAVSLFIGVTALWLGELLREAGGLRTYLDLWSHESNYRTQSILFGQSWSSELDTIGKTAFYLPIAMGGSLLALLFVVIADGGRACTFVRQQSRNPKAQYAIAVALPALLFYMFVFFMKAGYLLNVVPSAILAIAVLLDQSAIWLAERVKRKSENHMRLTRPIITRNVVILASGVAIANCFWFLLPWPGTEQAIYNNENTRNSFVHGAVNRFEHSGSKWLTLANRAFEYTSASGIRAVDSLNDATYHTLVAAGAADSRSVIIASWWSRWCYALLPLATTIDIETAGHPGLLAVGISRNMQRESISTHTLRLHAPNVFLLTRHDRPDFAEVSRQVHLTRLPLPECLDAYRVEDSSFRLHWGDQVFIRQ